MKRLLIADSANRERIHALLEEQGWSRTQADVQLKEIIGFKSSWIAADGAGVANYLENRILGCSYLMVTDAQAVRLAQDLDEAGVRLNADEVLSVDLGSVDETSALRTIGRLGLLAHGDFEPRVFSRLSALLISGNEQWQRIALYSLTNTSWDEFASVIQGCIDNDAFAADVAESAQSLLRDLQRTGWNRALYAE